MKQELLTMLTLQDEMNSRVHPQWRSQGYPWYRAIWIESAELMDHYGWKWWKKQVLDREQVELELIDIWHFGLSDLLQHSANADDVADALAVTMSTVDDVADFLNELEGFTLSVLQKQSFDVERFARLLTAVGMPFERLFAGYVGKNVLNFFRQDHGYKEGTYLKIWHGREDNEHLVEAIAELDCSSKRFRDELYRALQQRYPDKDVLEISV